MPKINMSNFDEIPDYVDLTIPSCKRATVRIVGVEDKPDIGNSGMCKFQIRVIDHPEADFNGREFPESFWYPDEEATQLQLLFAQSRWKQLCLATGVRPDSDGNLDVGEFNMTEFDAELTLRKNKQDGKSYTTLGDIYFSEEG